MGRMVTWCVPCIAKSRGREGMLPKNGALLCFRCVLPMHMAFNNLAREKWPLSLTMNLSMNGCRGFLTFAPTCPTYVGNFPTMAYVEQLGVSKLLFTSMFASLAALDSLVQGNQSTWHLW